MEKPILLTVSEVASLLRIQRAKVYILIETGALNGKKVGGDWRIRTDSVEALIGDLPETAFKCAA
jgi:excisionase family DNA binding protein